MAAIGKGHLDIANLLLEKGAKLDESLREAILQSDIT